MTNQWGGARTPANPAVVSGPGALSARTDGGVMNPNSPSYGEGATLDNLKSSAPLAGAARQPAPAATSGNKFAEQPPLSAPSTNPDQPVTAGADQGAGAGSSALNLPQTPGDERRADVAAIGPAAMKALIAAAAEPDATPSFRRLVRTALYA
jgi:hypothetical protein